MNNINLEVPAELITGNAHEIRYDLIEGKTIIGLCGYARSGKDTLAKPMVERLGFQRISFGDMLKSDLDEYMKVQVYEDLLKSGHNIQMTDINFLNPGSREIKELLRDYMIWFGEEMKKTNGMHHWTNRAFATIKKGVQKVVISDVRRLNELAPFEQNREYYRKLQNNFNGVNVPESPVNDLQFSNNYESLLIHINQRDLSDDDMLTIETIQMAHERWLFNHIVYVDSKIPNSINEKYREGHMLSHLLELVKIFPQYFV